MLYESLCPQCESKGKMLIITSLNDEFPRLRGVYCNFKKERAAFSSFKRLLKNIF